jgi:Asp-tRNA(Asn)/Glu-tRNA(Gln) amidotransferase A subunit family amidase
VCRGVTLANLAENVNALCDRIDADDREIQAYVPEPDRRGRLAAEAAELASRWPAPAARPALFGAPVAIKDVVRVDGLPTRAGSDLPPELFDGPQATVVTRLRDAGALVAGKSVTAEFAVLAPGPTRNPHNLEHTPGGSSSGSAASVAAGMTPYAIGTQTIGSMIRPAAYCGVVGFKPTYGRLPIDGVIANAPSLDTVGVFAADVAGVDLLASIVCDDWTRPAAAGRPVLGVPAGPYLERADPEALDAFAGHVKRLREAGYEVHDVPMFSEFASTVAQMMTVNRYETAQVHAEWFAGWRDRYRAETVAAIEEGQAISEAAHRDALAARDDFRAGLLVAMTANAVDLWVTPAATGPAPRSLATTGSSIMCLPWSFAGAPSISLPASYARNGLPLGLQCVGRAGADEQVVAWARGMASVFAAQ